MLTPTTIMSNHNQDGIPFGVSLPVIKNLVCLPLPYAFIIMGSRPSTTAFSFIPSMEIAGPFFTSKGISLIPSLPVGSLLIILSKCFPSTILRVSRSKLTGEINSAIGFGSSSIKIIWCFHFPY